MSRRGAARFCVLVVGLAAGCRSAENAEELPPGRSLPYRVYLHVDVPAMPSGAGEKPAEDAGDRAVAIPVDARRIEREVVLAAGPLQLCTELISRSSDAKDLEASLEEARSSGADLFLRVECEPKYAFSHRGAWFLPNTLLWFVLGFPSFYVPDRVYEVEWDVRYHLEPANEGEAPEPTEFTTLRTHVPLSVVDREFSFEALYTPPGFFEGSKAGQALTPYAEDLLVRDTISHLAERLRPAASWEREIEVSSPANHSSVRAEETDLAVRIAGKADLLRLRLELDGKVLAEEDVHSMSGLAGMRQLPDGSRLWKRPLAGVLGDGAPDPASRFADWNVTRTITFRTEGDGRAHVFRVLALTGRLADSTIQRRRAAP